MPLIDPITMASSVHKSSASESPTKQHNALQPVPTNTSPLAQAVRHTTPLLLLATFVWTFDNLVQDPIPAMRNLVLATSAYQLVSTLICLPAAGSATAKSARKPRPGEKKKEPAGPNIAVTTLLSTVLTTFSIPALHIVMVLFGAPFLTHIPHTLLCAAHLAVLAVFPLCYTHGVDGAAWRARASFRAPLDEAYGGAVGACVGAWLGAVPIPLDWDREWQKWPVTILCGMYGGYVLGRVLGGTVLFGKKASG